MARNLKLTAANTVRLERINQPVDAPADCSAQQAVQRQPETVYDEGYAADDGEEFFGEAEQYVAPVYDEAVETDEP